MSSVHNFIQQLKNKKKKNDQYKPYQLSIQNQKINILSFRKQNFDFKNVQQDEFKGQNYFTTLLTKLQNQKNNKSINNNEKQRQVNKQELTLQCTKSERFVNLNPKPYNQKMKAQQSQKQFQKDQLYMQFSYQIPLKPQKPCKIQYVKKKQEVKEQWLFKDEKRKFYSARKFKNFSVSAKVDQRPKSYQEKKFQQIKLQKLDGWQNNDDSLENSIVFI